MHNNLYQITVAYGLLTFSEHGSALADTDGFKFIYKIVVHPSINVSTKICAPARGFFFLLHHQFIIRDPFQYSLRTTSLSAQYTDCNKKRLSENRIFDNFFKFKIKSILFCFVVICLFLFLHRGYSCYRLSVILKRKLKCFKYDFLNILYQAYNVFVTVCTL